MELLLGIIIGGIGVKLLDKWFDWTFKDLIERAKRKEEST